jgi:hypothetical protein
MTAACDLFLSDTTRMATISHSDIVPTLAGEGLSVLFYTLYSEL